MKREDKMVHLGMRRKLVQLLHQKGIKNQDVLKAILKVPRHFFIDSAFLSHAYQDKAFAIAEGQTISQPYTVAYMTELLELSAQQNVLEIGTGSGYQAAILLELGGNLTTVEVHKKLHIEATSLLKTLGYKSFNCILSDGTMGYAQNAPYDRIIVTAGGPTIPKSLVDQLKVGGILVQPVGGRSEQQLCKITKLSEKQIKKELKGECKFVPLVGKHGW